MSQDLDLEYVHYVGLSPFQIFWLFILEEVALLPQCTTIIGGVIAVGSTVAKSSFKFQPFFGASSN